ncbi:hypothetical protein PPERSA_06621 [Pseudocohnilembus persalinus]|uniref:Uncharacterized protein n=1 Tax=Pseudocohnilembus persalinus TaxID=266149 RepID=A0A0V0QRT7_PSEPJ|nr:hypothetical protein PPERSA_06621 [Pseudocohnilembus persalinus]|eukprot:KRX04987.1 hypothetical protein PPERSA_06621 [Pseudocohnilembus persalinus]
MKEEFFNNKKKLQNQDSKFVDESMVQIKCPQKQEFLNQSSDDPNIQSREFFIQQEKFSNKKLEQNNPTINLEFDKYNQNMYQISDNNKVKTGYACGSDYQQNIENYSYNVYQFQYFQNGTIFDQAEQDRDQKQIIYKKHDIRQQVNDGEKQIDNNPNYQEYTLSQVKMPTEKYYSSNKEIVQNDYEQQEQKNDKQQQQKQRSISMNDVSYDQQTNNCVNIDKSKQNGNFFPININTLQKIQSKNENNKNQFLFQNYI